MALFYQFLLAKVKYHFLKGYQVFGGLLAAGNQPSSLLNDLLKVSDSYDIRSMLHVWLLTVHWQATK